MVSIHIWSITRLTLLLVITSQVLKTVLAEAPCDDYCNDHRPSGNDGSFTLDCSSLPSGEQVSCGLNCRLCGSQCAEQHDFSPEWNKISCGSKPAPSFTNNVSSSQLLGDGLIILIVVLVACGVFCIGVPICVFFCNQNRRSPYVTGGMGYRGAYGTPSVMMGGGMVASTVYTNPVSTTVVV